TKLAAAEQAHEGFSSAAEAQLAALDADRVRLDAGGANAERRWNDGEGRVAQARAERDELAARVEDVETKLAAAEKAREGLSGAAEAQLAALDAERTRAAAAWKEAEARADAAVGE